MVTTPADTALNTPVDKLIDAKDISLLVHAPPLDVDGTDIVDVEPSHIVDGPDITVLLFCTYNGVVLLQVPPK
jgi:hypothetical protein